MPGRKPYDAFGAFVKPLTSALACVANTKILTSPGGKNDMGTVHTLYITGAGNDDGYITLTGDQSLELRARMYYEIIRDPRIGYGPYRVTTRGYDYSLRTSDGCAVLEYHWHPSGKSHEVAPHIHLGDAQLRPDAVLRNKQHLPTGRITFEAVVKSAIESGALPLCDDFAERLHETELRHVQYRSWAGGSP